jgi:hypothetical protein
MHRPKKKIHLRAKLATMHELVSLSWPQQAKMPAGQNQLSNPCFAYLNSIGKGMNSLTGFEV